MKKLLYPLLAMPLLLSSCMRDIYVPYMPDKVNAPGFKGKNEAKADVSFAPNSKVTANLAYSPTNNFAIITSYSDLYAGRNSYSRNINKPVQGNDSARTSVTGNRFDLGFGYFRRMGGKGRLEAFAGFGLNDIKGSYIDTHTDTILANNYVNTYNIDMRARRFFIQAGVGRDGRIFSLMGGLKFSYQHFTFIDIAPVGSISGSQHFPNITIESPFHVQPYCDLRVGYKFVMFTTQLGLNFSSAIVSQYGSAFQSENSGTYPSAYITAGMVFHFSPEYFKMKVR